MMLGEPDAQTRTRRRREKRTDYVVEVAFGERDTYQCPGCGAEGEVVLLIPAGEPSFGGCSDWECDADLEFVAEDRSRGSAGVNRALGAYATDGGTEAIEKQDMIRTHPRFRKSSAWCPECLVYVGGAYYPFRTCKCGALVRQVYPIDSEVPGSVPLDGEPVAAEMDWTGKERNFDGKPDA